MEHPDGIVLFLVPGGEVAFVFDNFVAKTAHYDIEMVEITEENIFDYIEEISEEDLEFVQSLFGATVKDVLNEKKIEKKIEAIDYEKVKAKIDDKYKVSDEELVRVFHLLHKRDAKVARTFFEMMIFTMTMLNPGAFAMDKIMVAITNDPGLGKGAFTTNAMNALLQYANSEDKEKIVNVLKLVFFGITEAARKLD
jgi:hypothetical protein